MMDHEELMMLMSERIELHLHPLEETWRTMLKSEPESAFTAGYVQAFEEVIRAINFNDQTPEPTEFECGYYYACLVILGADTTGLGRDDA